MTITLSASGAGRATVNDDDNVGNVVVTITVESNGTASGKLSYKGLRSGTATFTAKREI